MFDSIPELPRLFRPDILDIMSRGGNSSMSEGLSECTRVSNSNLSKDVKGKMSEIHFLNQSPEKVQNICFGKRLQTMFSECNNVTFFNFHGGGHPKILGYRVGGGRGGSRRTGKEFVMKSGVMDYLSNTMSGFRPNTK